MLRSFYNSEEYRQKQGVLTRENWRRGTFDFLYSRDQRKCLRVDCKKEFNVITSNPKKYCSNSCAAIVSNTNRKILEVTKLKISQSLMGRKSPYKGILKVPRVQTKCASPICGKIFIHERYRIRSFCSNRCVMNVVGKRPTSPKASKGKAGIRKDVSPTIYFYSRWEANIARLYTYLGIPWVYEPTSFDIGGHTYTPDFYLPRTDTYIEVKNFWWEYSRMRDEKFRKLHKDKQLKVILKEEYLQLEKQYAHFIPNWEYKNSKFDIL